jgi:hypothetical protein
MMKAVRPAAAQPGAMGTGRIEPGYERREPSIPWSVGCPHHRRA